MDVIKIPSWWVRKDTDLRPQTADVTAKRVIRTRTEMIEHRKSKDHPYRSLNSRSESQVMNEEKSNKKPSDIIFIDFPAAGKRTSSRDQRDKATIIDVITPYSNIEPTFTFDARKIEHELDWNKGKYTSLSKMKEGRLLTERKAAHENFDKLLKLKSHNEQVK